MTALTEEEAAKLNSRAICTKTFIFLFMSAGVVLAALGTVSCEFVKRTGITLVVGSDVVQQGSSSAVADVTAGLVYYSVGFLESSSSSSSQNGTVATEGEGEGEDEYDEGGVENEGEGDEYDEGGGAGEGGGDEYDQGGEGAGGDEPGAEGDPQQENQQPQEGGGGGNDAQDGYDGGDGGEGPSEEQEGPGGGGGGGGEGPGGRRLTGLRRGLVVAGRRLDHTEDHVDTTTAQEDGTDADSGRVEQEDEGGEDLGGEGASEAGNNDGTESFGADNLKLPSSIMDPSCVAYSMKAQESPWLYSARVMAYLAVICGGIASLLLLLEICCFRVCCGCTEFFQSFTIIVAFLGSALSFLIFGSDYCSDSEFVRGGTCGMDTGAYYMVGAFACFMLSLSAQWCCSKNPVTKSCVAKACSKKKDDSDGNDLELSPVIETPRVDDGPMTAQSY